MSYTNKKHNSKIMNQSNDSIYIIIILIMVGFLLYQSKINLYDNFFGCTHCEARKHRYQEKLMKKKPIKKQVTFFNDDISEISIESVNHDVLHEIISEQNSKDDDLSMDI